MKNPSANDAIAVCEGFQVNIRADILTEQIDSIFRQQGCYLPNAPDQHTTVDEVAVTAGDEGEMPVGSEIRSVHIRQFGRLLTLLLLHPRLPRINHASNVCFKSLSCKKSPLPSSAGEFPSGNRKEGSTGQYQPLLPSNPFPVGHSLAEPGSPHCPKFHKLKLSSKTANLLFRNMLCEVYIGTLYFIFN